VVLPFVDPVFEKLATFSAGDWDFFDAEDFEGRSMEHLFNGSRGGFEDRKSYHLLEFEVLLVERQSTDGIRVEGGKGR